MILQTKLFADRGDVFTKAMLCLLNSKNNNAKKDLCLSYSQGNKSAYPTTPKAKARYLSTQYPNKTISHQHKKRDKNGKKGDYSKPENKDNNTKGTAGVHTGEVTTSEDPTIPSNKPSIDAHVLKVAKHKSRPAQSVEDLLGAHLINDAIWGCTDPSDVSIDTTDSAEIMAASYIREVPIFTFCRSDQHMLLNIAAHVPRKDDLSWYYELDFLDNYNNWNKSLNVTDTTNSGTNITGANFHNQVHHNYYDR